MAADLAVEANRAFADTLASRGLTLVRDDRNAVPLRRGARVLSVTAARRPDLTAGVHFDNTLRAAGVAVRSVYVDSDAGDTADYDAVLRTVADSDVVIVGSYVATRWDAASIAQSGAFVDFATYAGVAMLLAIVSSIACGLPAWRAARVRPSEALRSE